MIVVRLLRLAFMAALCALPTLCLATATVNLSFSPATINPGDPSTMAITLYNSALNPLNTAAVTLNLATGVTIGAVPNVSNTCGFGSVSAPANGAAVVLSGGTVPAAVSGGADGSCTFTVSVNSISTGNHTTTIPANGPANGFTAGGSTPGFSASDNGSTVTNATAASATLAVGTLSNPTGTLAFSPSSVQVGETTTLTITLNNPNASVNLPLTALTPTLPSGLVIAPTPNAQTTCSGATLSSPSGGGTSVVAGDTSITLTGGTIAAAASCTLSVSLKAPVTSGSGSASASVASNGIGNSRGLSSSAFSSTLTLNDPVSVSQSMSSGGSTVRAGQVVTLTLTISNASSANSLNITSFTDNLASGMVINAGVTPAVTCTGTGASNGTLTATAASTTLSLVNAVAGPNGHCTISVGVSMNAAGTLASTSVTTAPGTQMSNAAVSPGNLKVPSSTANLTAAAGLTVSKSVSPTNPYAGQALTYTITITNWSGGALSNVNFTDNLPAVAPNQMVLSVGSALGAGCSGGALNAAAGSSSVTWTGGTVVAGSGTSAGTCTITLNASMPAAAAVGDVFTNTLAANSAVTATDINSNSLTNPSSSSASATAKASMTVSQSFSSTTITQGGTTNLKVTFNNPTAGAITNTSFTDVLDANLKISPTPSITSSNCTGSTPVLTAVAGSNSFSVSGLTVPANTSNCVVQVSVTSTMISLSTRLNATIAANNVSNDQGLSNTADVVASTGVKVNSAISASKQFSPSSVGVNGITRVTITINNGSTMALTNLSLTDPMQTGANAFVVANSPNVSTTCGGTASVSAPAGGTAVSMTGGALAASGSCTLSFDVRMTSGNSWTNTLTGNNTSGSITSAEGAYNTSNVTASAANSLTAAAAFSPSSAALGGTSRLSLTISNSGSVPFTNLSVSPAMQTGGNAFTLASNPNASSTCAGNPVISATGGATSLSMAGATLAAGASCVLSVDVTTTAGGPWTYTLSSGAITSAELATNSGSTTASLSKLTGTPLTLNKSFSPVSIVGGNPSVLRIDLANANAFAVNSVALTDVFPSGMLVHSVPGVTTNCTNAVVTAPVDATQLGISNIDLAASSSCYVMVNVTSIKPLNLTNTIAVGAVSSRQGLSNSAATSASLSTLQGVGVQKSFLPTAVSPGQTSRLTVKLVSTLNTVGLSNVAVTDTLPTGVVIANTPNLASTCNSAPTATPAGSSVSISGVALAAQANCTFSVDVTAASVGTYVNTIPVGAVTSTENYANQTAASATLTVDSAPTVSVAYGVASIQTGASTTLTTTITNTSAQALSGVALTNRLPTGLSVALTPSASTSCAGATVTAAASGTGIAISGGSIAAGASCTFVANVTSNTPGSYVDTVPVSAIASTQGLTNTSSATATLTVLQLPTVTQGLSLSAISPGATTVWTVTLGNSNASAITLSSALTISLPTLPGNLVIAATPGVSKTCTGTVTATAGAGSMTYANSASIPAGGCSISVNLTATPLGSYTISIPAGALQTSAGNSQQASSVMLTVTNTTPPVANNFSATMSNTVASAQSIGPMSGTASAPATLGAYTIRSLPLGTYGTLYCNAVAVTTVPLSCGPSQLSFMPVANSVGVATMTYTVQDSNGVDSAAATGTITITAPAAWKIGKAAPGSVTAGGAMTYTITLTNIGGSTSGTSATVKDVLPAGVTVTAVTPGSGVNSVSCGANFNSPMVCTVSLSGGLAVNGTASFSYTATAPNAAGLITNYIGVDPSGGSSPPTDPTTTCSPTTACASASTNVTSAAQPAAWAITKTHSGSMTAGGTGSYTVTVSNSGGSASTASTVTVTDTPPTGMTVTGMSGTGWTCANNSGWACTRSDSLAANASYPTLLVAVSIASNASTPLVNSTTVSGGGVASSATATDSTNITPPAAAFGIAKAATSSVATGGSITYTITLSNIGGSTSGTSAMVKDMLPAGVTVTAVTPGSGVNSVSCGANFNPPMVCTVTLSSGLAVNGTASFSYTATAPNTIGAITNYIGVDPSGGSSPPTDPTTTCTPTTACASASTTVIGPDVYTTISAPSSVANGAVANLVHSFGNQGAVAAQGVTYQLTLPTTVTGVSCGAASCAFNAATGVLTLTGLPTTLVVGQQVSVNVSYRAPVTGNTALSATSLIATTTPGEAPSNNNSANAVTNITAAATQPDPTTALRAPATSYPGSAVAVDISYTNLGADNAQGLGFAVSGFPNTGTPAFSYNGIVCTWNQATGAVTGCGLPSTLPVGQSISLRASYTAPSSGSVTLTSTVSSTSVDANNSNNTATAVTTVVSQPPTPVADVTTSVSVPGQAYGGSTVLVPLVFQNLGPASAISVSYAVSLTGGASNLQVSNNGVLCAYSGGSISGCNLPGALAAGQAVNLVLSFTAPAAPASVTVTSTVSTSTVESNAGNNSATGSLSVPTLQPTGTISGRVWYDANRNRRYDSGEVGRASWSVDLLQGGSPIARTSTDANGQYSFTGLADGVYAVRFMPWMGSGTLPVNGESGTAITGGGIPGQSILDNIVIANVGTRNFRLKIGGDVVTEQSLPIDPSGTVYDSSTRQPIAGATVTLGYACGSVDSSWLAGSSSVTTGADGSYAFFLLPAAPSACNYTLTVSKTGYTSPSTVIPSSGSWPAGGGAVTGVSGAPSGGQATTYYLSGPKPTTDLTNNNIPLDPQAVVPGAAPASVPTLSTWALLLLMTGLAALAAPRMARRPRAGGG